jgi:hypothetical protein
VFQLIEETLTMNAEFLVPARAALYKDIVETADEIAALIEQDAIEWQLNDGRKEAKVITTWKTDTTGNKTKHHSLDYK